MSAVKFDFDELDSEINKMNQQLHEEWKVQLDQDRVAIHQGTGLSALPCQGPESKQLHSAILHHLTKGQPGENPKQRFSRLKQERRVKRKNNTKGESYQDRQQNKAEKSLVVRKERNKARFSVY